jgi:hypothetical protein
MRTTRFIGALLFVSAAAHTQTVTNGRLVYGADFFTHYSPRTALDMINETPGFVLEETTDRRGFAGAAGNILIDGERPIAKSQTLSDILQRIPASQVVRIEIIRGGDDTGHAVVANVVCTHSASSGVYQLGFEYAGHIPAPNGWVSWSGRSGKTDYSVGGNGYSFSRNLPGKRKLLDGSGILTGARKDESPRTFYQIGVNPELGRPMLGGRLHITGEAFQSRYQENSTVSTFDLSGKLLDFQHNPYSEFNRKLESGIDFDRPVGPWDLSLSALLTRNHFSSHIRSTDIAPSGAVGSIFQQRVARSTGESIARATLARSWGSTHRLEFGAEGAINTLNQKLALTIDLGGGSFPLPVPNSNLSVREDRGEAYVLHQWTPMGWSIETRLAGEASRLSFTGDTNQSVSLAYFKPSIQIARNIGARDQVRLHIYRDVGQLEFLDFVSVASPADQRINGGNPNLKPETSWRAEAAADLRFGSEGSLSLTLFHYWLSDAKDIVPVRTPSGLIDAPGNIGKGSVDGTHLTFTLPLKAVLSGASLTVDGTLRRSRVIDPLTGKRRQLSDYDHRLFKADFRQDLPKHKLAWGMTYTDQPMHVFYRFAEIERDRDSPSLDLWVERPVLDGLKARLSVLSLLGQPQYRERIFFAPDRRGTISSIERTHRYPGRWLNLTLSGSF